MEFEGDDELGFVDLEDAMDDILDPEFMKHVKKLPQTEITVVVMKKIFEDF